MSRMGIVRRGRHLYWGWKHGALLDWPDFVKDPIVWAWNRVSCDLFGHGLVFEGLCCDCCRRTLKNV